MNLLQRTAKLRMMLGILHGHRAFGGPHTAELAVSNQCNIRCIHCYYHSPLLESPSMRPVRKARVTGQEVPDREELAHLQALKADTMKTNRLIDELLELGTRGFQFSGSGEIFLHKNVMDFLGRVKHGGGTLRVLTAGHMLNREIIDSLLEMNCDLLTVTTMAGDRDTFLSTHPGIPRTTFDDLQEKLLYIADRKKALRMKRPIITLTCVVISENHDGLMKFAEFADHVQADAVRLKPFDDVRDPGLATLIPSVEQAASVREQMKEVRHFLEAKGIMHNVDTFLKVFGKKLDTRALYDVIPCYYLWYSCRIEPDGTLFPCCRGYDSPGNVHERGFRDIWFGDSYRRLRHEAITLHNRHRPVTGCMCDTCVNFSANLRIHKYLHPFQGRSERLKRLNPLST